MSARRWLAAVLLLLLAAAGNGDAHLREATFAGGCFWCMEEAFDEVAGVVSTTSGYTGGETPSPTYGQVSGGGTGHAEAVRVVYDPTVVDYERLLVTFWHNIDPLDGGGQFCDRGSQYRSAVFAHDAEQRRLAEESRRYLEARAGFGAPVVTEIADAGQFHAAEPEHQDYYQRNPLRYRFYKFGCGRADRLEQLWGEAAGTP